jgi:hypothetical protein
MAHAAPRSTDSLLPSGWPTWLVTGWRFLVWLVLVVTLNACGVAMVNVGPDYQSVSPSHDGIGKVYLGREIAQTMGYEGAAWLERPSRTLQESPQKAIDGSGVAPHRCGG